MLCITSSRNPARTFKWYFSKTGASHGHDETEHLDWFHEIQSGWEQKEKNCGSEVEIKQVVSQRRAINRDHHWEIPRKSR